MISKTGGCKGGLKKRLTQGFIGEAPKSPAAEAVLTDESLKGSAAHVHGLGRLGDIAVVAGERACQVLPGEIAHHLTSHVLKTKFLTKRIGMIEKGQVLAGFERISVEKQNRG